jgi:hypothetical protein
MTTLTGTLRTEHLMVVFEANQTDNGERWQVITKINGQRDEQVTYGSPWPLIERMTAEALDNGGKLLSPPKYDMDRRVARSQPIRRRKTIKPGDLPTPTIERNPT